MQKNILPLLQSFSLLMEFTMKKQPFPNATSFLIVITHIPKLHPAISRMLKSAL
jgi:hypothetical protein